MSPLLSWLLLIAGSTAILVGAFRLDRRLPGDFPEAERRERGMAALDRIFARQHADEDA